MLTPQEHTNLKAVLFKLLDYEVHEQAVADFHLSLARTKIISCPARTSKSYAGWKDALPDAYAPGIELSQGKPEVDSCLIWIVAPNYDLAKEFDYAWEDLVSRRAKLGMDYKIEKKANQPKQGHMLIDILWGKDSRGVDVRTKIEVKSAFNEKSLQSEEVNVVLMSEAARLPKVVWSKYLSTRAGRSIWPTTPDIEAAWIWQLIEDGKQHDQLGIENFQFTGRANPSYKWDRFWTEHAKAESLVDGTIEVAPVHINAPPSEKNGHDCFDPLTECKAMKEDGFAEQFGGRWVFHRGRVVPLRERESDTGAPSHVISEDFAWMKDAHWSLACDYGYEDPAVGGFWATGPGRQLVLRNCVYQNHLTPDQFVDQLLEMWGDIQKRFGFKRTFPHRVIGDPKKPEVEALMRRRGLPVWNMDKKAQASRHAGHQELMSYLATDLATGLPRLLVHTDCAPVIKEWRMLRRNDRVRDEGSHASMIGRDDAYDMARYFVMSRPTESNVVTKPSDFDFARRQIIRERARRPRNVTVPQGMQPVGWRAA